MKVAVFGHYDSRGGTTAIKLPDEPTEADVLAAIKLYNERFEWEADLARYKADPSKWGWDPTQPGSSPAENDFLFIADLHGDVPMDVDLEDSGVVLIDESSGVEHDKYTADAMNESPTQLEYVPLGKSRYESETDFDATKEDDGDWEKWIGTQGKVLKGPTVGTRSWNDDAFGFIVESEQ